MSDFKFIRSVKDSWIISAPKRGKRPDQAKGGEPPCPFEFIDGKVGDQEPLFTLNQVRVITNIYPFAPHHEIVVHSEDHRKNFGELDYSLAEDIFKVYHLRFVKHKKNGQVYIFHNRGKEAGESLPHPHSQITVVPYEVELKIPQLSLSFDQESKMLSHFYIFCPQNSKWPDEVWIAPKREGRSFSEASADEIKELSFIVSRLVQIFTIRYNEDFPYNLYIYPGDGWYLRIIPRLKVLGGFEVGTNVFINTQDPRETFKFIDENFENPDFDKIREIHQAEYRKSV